MGKLAGRVYFEAADIARLEQRVRELAENAHVRVTLDNGDMITGVIAERPNVQVFEDGAGTEGLNGLVRIESAAAPHGSVYIWLDAISRVERVAP